MVCFKSFYPLVNSVIASHKQYLILTPLLSSVRTSSLEDKYSESRSEILEDASDSLDLTQQLCQETGAMPAAEGEARREARRKLFIAAALTLVFMIGEVIGKFTRELNDPLPQ